MPQAVERELLEETGLTGGCGDLIGWVERLEPDRHQVILDFQVTVTSSLDPMAGDDAAEAAWVPLDAVERLRLAPGLAEFLLTHGILGGLA